MAIQINTGAISTTQAKMAYESFYVPAMQYSLPITSINQMDFDSIQRNAMTSILAALGYNRHMPREIVFCTTKFQGLGPHHLYDIQGTDSTRLLISELNHHGTTRNMIQCTLDVIQMEAGIGKPILEDNQSLIYIEWGWIPSIRDFLLHINGKITNATTIPELFREHDSYIMDAPLLATLSRKEQILINRSRLLLQVECLSDIGSSDGTRILEDWMSAKENTPSYSRKSWPRQGDPGAEAWKIWRTYLEKAFLTNGVKLRRPLGSWTKFNRKRIHFAYFHPTEYSLWVYLDRHEWTKHKLIKNDRRSMVFHVKGEKIEGEIPECCSPIDIESQNENDIVTSRHGSVTGTTPVNNRKQQKLEDKIRH
jgi:hypothetical protein